MKPTARQTDGRPHEMDVDCCGGCLETKWKSGSSSSSSHITEDSSADFSLFILLKPFHITNLFSDTCSSIRIYFISSVVQLLQPASRKETYFEAVESRLQHLETGG